MPSVVRAVDTNVLVRLLTRDDPKQTAAAEAFVAAGAWVPLIVLVETSWVLATVYEVPPAGLADAIEMLLRHEHLQLQEPDVVEAAVADYRRQPSVGFSDWLILASARKAGHLPLGTFDKSLGKAKGTKALAS